MCSFRFDKASKLNIYGFNKEKLLEINVDILNSASTLQHCSILLAEFNVYFSLFIFADQVFMDPTFSGIFVCGPLQSFMVNVCAGN